MGISEAILTAAIDGDCRNAKELQECLTLLGFDEREAINACEDAVHSGLVCADAT